MIGRTILAMLPERLIDAGLDFAASSKAAARAHLGAIPSRLLSVDGVPLFMLGEGPGLDALVARLVGPREAQAPARDQGWHDLLQRAREALESGAVLVGRVHRNDCHRLAPLEPVILPELVDLVCPIDPDPHWTPPGRSVRNSLHRAKKWPFTTRVTTSTAAFERFYDTMYIPFVHRQFGPLSTVRSAARLRLDFDRGALIELLHDGDPVGGVLVRAARGDLLEIVVAFAETDEKARSEGANAILSRAVIDHARDRGLARVNQGGSLPFLTDPVLRNKQDWGGWLAIRERADHRLVLVFAQPSPLVARFIEILEPVALSRQGLIGLRLREAKPLRDFRHSGLARVIELGRDELRSSKALLARIDSTPEPAPAASPGPLVPEPA